MLALENWLGLEAHAEPERTAVGGAGRLVVEVTIPEGCHIESHQPSAPFLIPTVLAFEDVEGVAIGAVDYPREELKTFDWSPTELRVYRGTIELAAPFEISAGAPAGSRRVVGRVRYQGCTEALCYPPAEQEVTVSLDVV